MNNRRLAGKRTGARPRLSPPARQRGVAAVFTAIAILALITAVFLGINIGQLYYAQRDLQKQASLAAIAGVSYGSGCKTGTPSTLAAVTTAVTNSLTGNGASSGSALLTGFDGAPAVELGMITTTTGTKIFTSLSAGDSRINAVRVNLSEPEPTLFGSGFFPGTTAGTLTASGTAEQTPLGAFAVGSGVLSVNTGTSVLNSLLGGLLGTSLSLTAVDYQGLANTKLTLAGLEAALGANDLNSLLATNSNLATLKAALATATATVNPTVSTLIGNLALGATQAATTIQMNQVLGNLVSLGNPSPTDPQSQLAFVDALDLLTALGEAAANKNNSAITLPISLGVNGLVNLAAFVTIDQPMQPSALGPVGVTAKSAAVTLKVRANVQPTILSNIFNLVNSLVGLLVTVNTPTINLGLDISVANATGTLESITCPTATVTSPTATVAVTTNFATIKLGAFSGSPSSFPPLDKSKPLISETGTLLGSPVTVLSVSLKNDPVSSQLGSGSGTAGPFTVFQQEATQPAPHTVVYDSCNTLGTPLDPCGTTTDPANPSAPVPSSDLAAGISSLLSSAFANNNLQGTLLNLNFSAIVDTVVSTLNSALVAPLTTLLDSIVTPLLKDLGVQVGTGTVLMLEVQTGPPILATIAPP